MDALLDKAEQSMEIVVFDLDRIEGYSNEYADELREEINKIPGFRARIEPEEPRIVIRERLL